MPLPRVVKYKLKIFVLVSLGGVISALSVRADKIDFLVNDDGTRTEQSRPRIAVAGDGKFVIVWMDKRNGNNDIYLQKYLPSGSPIGRNVKVNDDPATAYQAEPAIGVDFSGLFSVVWKDYRNGSYPFGPDLYFQRYDTAVAPLGTNRNLATEWPDSLIESPDIALSMWGNGVVVWADYRNGNWDIYGQLVASNGSLVGSNFRINDDIGIAQQHAPRVAYSSSGWFVVAWYDNRMGNDDIFVQRFDSLGNRLRANIKVNSDAGTYRQAFPDIAADESGHFSVVWVDWRNGVYPANPDIYYRKYDTTMAPLVMDRKINSDGTVRAQREPALAADRMGNLAMVWSDSNASSWDITGQMLDFTGKLQGTNFRINHDGDSAQLQPDIALDGRNRYAVWVDKRNGHYDIYASIAKYNDPTIIPEPGALKFVMECEGDLPPAQSLVVNHAGYNPLNFTVSSPHDWLTIAPLSGITPETLSVAVINDTLPFGTYLGVITLIDNDFGDSSASVSVRLDVTAPIMTLSEDTLFFRAFARTNEGFSQNLAITNSGTGQFFWQCREEVDWLSLSAISGIAPASVEVRVNAYNLTAGNYVAPLIIEAERAVGSPDTVWIFLDVIDNMPYMVLEPDSIYIQTAEPGIIDTFVVIHNLGTGIISWTASSTAFWLKADRLSGFAEDTIHLTVDTTLLSPGLHAATLEFTDSAAFNTSVILPFVLNFGFTDTVLFHTVQVDSGKSVVLPVAITLVNDMAALSLPVKYDAALINVDSVIFNRNLPGFFNFISQVNNIEGRLYMGVEQNYPDSVLASGTYLLAEIYLTATGAVASSVIDTALSDSLTVYILNDRGQRLVPFVIPGMVQVNIATGLYDDLPNGLPRATALMQNYPNPFNLVTNIPFELAARTRVELEVFNILGQKVNSLVNKELPPGRYNIDWPGIFDNGRTAPSGIYFYRLQTENTSLVKKMILLK